MNIFSAVKSYFTVKSVITTEIKEARMPTASGKPGWKTTEFWMNVATQAGVLWGAVHGFIPQPYAVVISIAGVAIYTIARTIGKAVSDIQTVKSGTTSAA